ncbi:MAG: hypothetical protein LEGION0398_MBIBDBAK_01249 [Legionellaceae bacterium]
MAIIKGMGLLTLDFQHYPFLFSLSQNFNTNIITIPVLFNSIP